MSKAYPNYQNKSYYNYIQFVKENENFFEKLRLARAIVDDHCPESLIYMKHSGKLHKYYTYLEQEKEKLKQNKHMLKKLSNTLSKRSSSNYLSNPYPTKLLLENRNFMDDFSKKNKGIKNYEENAILDKKIKMSKSNYALGELEKDFERILGYKKLISQKNNLFFESLSPHKSKTGLDFFSSKKSKERPLLPRLSKKDEINSKTNTTSTNFFKNNQEKNKSNLLLSAKNSGSVHSNNINNMSLNQLNNLKTISIQNTKKSSEKDTKNLIYSQTTNNFKYLNEEILEEINTERIQAQTNNDLIDDKTNNFNNVVASSSNLNNVLMQSNIPAEIDNENENEVRIGYASPIISNLNELNLVNGNIEVNNNDCLLDAREGENISQNKEENLLNKDQEIKQVLLSDEIKLNNSSNNINDQLDNQNEEDKAVDQQNAEIGIDNFAKKIEKAMYKSHAKSSIHKANKNLSFESKDNYYNPLNRSNFIPTKNRIIIDSDKSISNLNKSLKNEIDDLNINKSEIMNNQQNEALENMRKLEEMELNDDISQKEKSFQKERSIIENSANKNSIIENINEENKNEENKNEEHKNEGHKNEEKIIACNPSMDKSGNSLLHKSKMEINQNSQSQKFSKKNSTENNKILNENHLTKNPSIHNSFLKIEESTNNLNLLNKNSQEEIYNEENINPDKDARDLTIKNNSKENYSNYFGASNNNFYSTALNVNNNGNNIFNSSKNNFMAFDNTGSSNNIFSLTTVNNFNSNNIQILNNNYNNNFNESPIPNYHPNSNFESNKDLKNLQQKTKSESKINKRYQPVNYLKKLTKSKSKSKSPKRQKNEKKEKPEIFELEEETIKNNIKTVLYCAKAFMDKLNLVDVTVYMRNKMLFVEVNPISVLSEKVFILCFEKKEDRQMISKIFKNYQSFVNNLYYDYPKIEVKTKHPINYISNSYFKADLQRIEAERTKLLI